MICYGIPPALAIAPVLAKAPKVERLAPLQPLDFGQCQLHQLLQGRVRL